MLSGSDGMGPYFQGPQQRLVKAAPGMWWCCGPDSLPIPSLPRSQITHRTAHGTIYSDRCGHGSGAVQTCQSGILEPQ